MVDGVLFMIDHAQWIFKAGSFTIKERGWTWPTVDDGYWMSLVKIVNRRSTSPWFIMINHHGHFVSMSWFVTISDGNMIVYDGYGLWLWHHNSSSCICICDGNIMSNMPRFLLLILLWMSDYWLMTTNKVISVLYHESGWFPSQRWSKINEFCCRIDGSSPLLASSSWWDLLVAGSLQLVTWNVNFLVSSVYYQLSTCNIELSSIK